MNRTTVPKSRQSSASLDETAVIPSVRIVSQFGSIATCRLPRAAILDVRECQSVASLKASRLVAPEESPSQTAEEIISVWGRSDERRPAGLQPTGKGVVIGILDWGADFGLRRLSGGGWWHETARTMGSAWPSRSNATTSIWLRKDPH